MNLFTLFFLSLFSSVLSLTLPLFRRDVFVPPILYPTKTTVWRVGEEYHVIWCVSPYLDSFPTPHNRHRNITSPPAQISNPFGQIYLRKGGEQGLTDLGSKWSLHAGNA
jgi:hypothetical protein